MNDVEFEPAPTDQGSAQRPRTFTVVGLLLMTAATLSYLGAYAMANALVAAELLRPWSRDHDPRLRWFLTGFVALAGLFTGIAALARLAGSRHLKQLEQMEADEDVR